ncbi:iron-containing alcohol dehydrogenase [Candidatus Bathyarchaeota archaeon]|nr:iron-containing alcohol dehydrogenase [Candidatus Bathyarchaeota archaeon]
MERNKFIIAHPSPVARLLNLLVLRDICYIKDLVIDPIETCLREVAYMRGDLILPYSFNLLTTYSPKKIVVGLDAVNVCVQEFELKAGMNVLIVTDKGVQDAGIVKRITDELEDADVSFDVYDGVEADPKLSNAEEVAEKARGGNYDAVIGLGGGSSMDMAKVASLSVSNPGRIEVYVGVDTVKHKGLPLYCIPTTAGTGSEVTRVAVVTVGKIKRAIVSSKIVPDVALVDPKLTVSMPPKVTVGSGLDALSHAVEAILSLDANPMTIALGLEAVRLISENLRVAYCDGRNVEARYHMSLAATMAGLSFNGPGLVHGHSIAQTFGPLYGVPHGLSCAMTLPYIMEFYLPAVPERLAWIAEAMGEDVYGLSLREAGKLAVEAVYELCVELDVPSLKDVGVEKERIPEIAEFCVREWVRPNSPRLLKREDAIKILEKMWEGEL